MALRSFPLSDDALLELTGDDRTEWLQGQATNDVRLLKPRGRLSFLFCEPTGQLLAILEAWAFDDRIVMSTARERVSAVLDRVESMTILEDVAAREIPGAGLWLSDAPPEGPWLALPSGRTAEGGWDVWGAEADLRRLAEQAEPVDSEPLRIAAGVPKWGVDAGPRTLPAELGPAFERAHVSYAKGCYTGQEVLMRMHTRGHANRTWVGLVADEALVVGEPVFFSEREVGRVTSAAALPDQYLGAAMLRNEAAAEGTAVRVGGARAEVRTMPLVRTA